MLWQHPAARVKRAAVEQGQRIAHAVQACDAITMGNRRWFKVPVAFWVSFRRRPMLGMERLGDPCREIGGNSRARSGRLSLQPLPQMAEGTHTARAEHRLHVVLLLFFI
jgi:hypothetical protein